MSSNKYSHALVMSHFHDSGLLDDSQRTQAKHRSAARSSSRISQSWTIAEVLPPPKSTRSSSPGHISEIRRKPSVQENEKVPLSGSTPDDIPEHFTSLSRSDSVVTQVYAPRRSSPPYEKQRVRQSRNSRAQSGLRASIISQHEGWEPRLSTRGVASPKSPRCTCGAIVQDVRLQSTYFPDTKAPQKPLPNLPADMSKSKHVQDAAVQEQGSTPRFELPASYSPHQMPTMEATIKPIRRMAPTRSPTTITPTSARTSISWPKPPEPTTTTSPIIGNSPSPSSEAFSNSRPLSMTDTRSRPLSPPTTPPTSPSLSSIFSFPSQKAYQEHPHPSSYNKLPIHDRDIARLPWDDPEMGPSVFCSSPPLSLNYLDRPPSAASSIDDATPPPISRVRRSPSASAPKPPPRRQQQQQQQRARAVSSPPSVRPKPSHAPPMPGPGQRQSYNFRKPSLDIRTEPTAIPYHDLIAGPEPIPTSERIAPPPPLSGGLIRASKEKEVEKMKWGRLRGLFGFGSGRGVGKGMGVGMGTAMGVGLAGGKGLDSGFVRGLVPN